VKPEAETGNRKLKSFMSDKAFQKRTFGFGIRCVRLVETLQKSMPAQTIGKQLLQATSVGANYRAAVRGRSRPDFLSRMGIVEEECDEALYWLDVLIELDSSPENGSNNCGTRRTKLLRLPSLRSKPRGRTQRISEVRIKSSGRTPLLSGFRSPLSGFT
jgi:four helix bundle protein